MKDDETQVKLLRTTDQVERALVRMTDRFWMMTAVAAALATLLALSLLWR